MTTSEISRVTEEGENYLRIDLLLTGICPRAVRVLFDTEFHPRCLQPFLRKIRIKLSKMPAINRVQQKLLFPEKGVPDSKNFDVTLMVLLLRNFANLNQPAAGYEQLPRSTNIEKADDLARIKHYRNQLSHFKDVKMESVKFNIAWEDICGAVRRLGGEDMDKECTELRTICLDQATVSWDRRKQIIKTLVEWEMTDTNFVETSAAQQVFECVKEHSCVTITASFGVGKTATLQHVALKMAVDGYDVLPVTSPCDIVEFYDPKKKTLFVIDDFCGKYSINQYDLDRWEPVRDDVEQLIQNKDTKIIVACRFQVFKDERFESLSIFRTNICNLLSEDFCLSQNEKQLIAEMYLKTKANSDNIQYYNLFNCFPHLCTVYHDDSPTLSVRNFFKNAFQVYEAEIKQLKQKKFFSKYCALALCVIFNNALLEEMFTEETNIKTQIIIQNTCEACTGEEIPKLTLFDELDSLEHTFLKKDGGVYSTLNDTLFNFITYFFGQNIIQCLIKNAHIKLIEQNFVLEEEEAMDQFITVVPPKYHQMYIKRMIDDWSTGEVVTVFNNKNMKNQTFRHMILSYLKTLDISYQRQLAQTCDTDYNDSVLLQCCFKGYIPLIQWCCHQSVDIKRCLKDDTSSLFILSHEGHSRVMEILLDKKDDKCTDDDTFPMCIACDKKHADIAKHLIDNKANSNMCRNDKTSPLFIACQKGFKDIVEILLENMEGIYTCGDTETYSLIMVCSHNLEDIEMPSLDH